MQHVRIPLDHLIVHASQDIQEMEHMETVTVSKTLFKETKSFRFIEATSRQG